MLPQKAPNPDDVDFLTWFDLLPDEEQESIYQNLCLIAIDLGFEIDGYAFATQHLFDFIPNSSAPFPLN